MVRSGNWLLKRQWLVEEKIPGRWHANNENIYLQRCGQRLLARKVYAVGCRTYRSLGQREDHHANSSAERRDFAGMCEPNFA
jgi:hypothetical protein